MSLIATGPPTRLLCGGPASAYEAALAAALIRELLISRGISFAFETVMSHPSKLQLFIDAQAYGYQTHMYFVCTSDVETNVARVAKRVAENGHDVPVDKIRSRYTAAIALLPRAAAICDIVSIVDTSEGGFDVIAVKRDGAWTTKSPLPNWAASAVI